jgi:integrase
MQSTLMTQNAALNRVFDEAVDRGFMTPATRPALSNKGKGSDRRPAFELEEVRALRSNFDAWIAGGRTPGSRELRALLRDYVEVLLDTGARPGDELLNLQWKQVLFVMRPTVTKTDAVDADGEPIELANLNRSCLMTVDGKTGMREIAGMKETVNAFVRIIERNYCIKNKITEPFKGVAVPTNDDYVFRTKDKSKPTSFQKMFESYLDEHNLLIDPATGQKRVFYSLRHTYATMALTHDVVPLETLRVQMGTSIAMIAKHYSHLKVRNTLDQLRRSETRRLLESGAAIDDMYRARPKRQKAS